MVVAVVLAFNENEDRCLFFEQEDPGGDDAVSLFTATNVHRVGTTNLIETYS